MEVEERNLALEQACFEQWLAWWKQHAQGKQMSEVDGSLVHEAYLAGWSRAQTAARDGWTEAVEPPPLRLDGAINRVVSRK